MLRQKHAQISTKLQQVVYKIDFQDRKHCFPVLRACLFTQDLGALSLRVCLHGPAVKEVLSACCSTPHPRHPQKRPCHLIQNPDQASIFFFEALSVPLDTPVLCSNLGTVSINTLVIPLTVQNVCFLEGQARQYSASCPKSLAWHLAHQRCSVNSYRINGRRGEEG